MAFVAYKKDSGVVVGCQEFPIDRCLLVESVSVGVAEISEGQLERVKECAAEGVTLEYKNGRLYV